jgi:hypothetical protein
MRRSAGRGKTRSSRSVRRPAARRQSRGRHEDARRTAQERLTRESYGWSSRSAARAERAAAPPCAHGEAECIGRAEVEPLHIVEGDEQRLRLGEQLGRASRRDADPARIERLLRLLQQERDLQGTPPRRRERGSTSFRTPSRRSPNPPVLALRQVAGAIDGERSSGRCAQCGGQPGRNGSPSVETNCDVRLVARISRWSAPDCGRRRWPDPHRAYLISVSSLNIGRYMLMITMPTMIPTPSIMIGSTIDVSDWIEASTSSS